LDNAGRIDVLNVTVPTAAFALRLAPLAAGRRRYALRSVSDHYHANVPITAPAYDLTVHGYAFARRPIEILQQGK
jgi:hypothetical protein